MAQSIFNTARFRTLFSIWWLNWMAMHAFVVSRAGYHWTVALLDSAISNFLLAGTVYLVTISLHYYTPQKNRYGYLFSLCLALTVLWIFVSHLALFLILGNQDGYHVFFLQTQLIRGAFGFLMISCMELVAVLWYTIQDQKETDKRRTEAERLSKEAELNNLRQQLQPHFLFNSLNSINALIGLQPQRARVMIQQLSDFLRGTLKKEQKEWTTLEDEIRHLQLYLEIEKVRFGHRLNTDVSNDAEGTRLPVMLLQPVVENAIKFGLYDTTDAITITIHARREINNLVVQITNPFDPETSLPKKGAGFGLQSVQRRLALLFARHDLLQTKTDDTTFVTTIKIPQP